MSKHAIEMYFDFFRTIDISNGKSDSFIDFLKALKISLLQGKSLGLLKETLFSNKEQKIKVNNLVLEQISNRMNMDGIYTSPELLKKSTLGKIKYTLRRGHIIQKKQIFVPTTDEYGQPKTYEVKQIHPSFYSIYNLIYEKQR